MNRPRPEDPDEVLNQASRWFLAAREGRLSDAEAAEMETWFAEHPEHHGSYQAVAAGWDVVGVLAAQPELMLMRRGALANASKLARRRRAPRLWLSVGAVAACLLAVATIGLGYLTLFGPERTATYQTASGERRTLMLEDQSRVVMDGATRLEVRYSGRSRSVRLLSGQAEFQVAHNPRRPFAVTAAGRTVVATGTAFNVDLMASNLVVTLIEGHVLVADAAAWTNGKLSGTQTSRPIEMDPAQQLVVTPDRKLVLRSNIDPAAAVAWKLGKLVFDNEPLSQAVERMNRYAGRRISLLDPAIAATRVSGVFDAADSAAFVEAVTAQLKLRSVEGPSGALMLYKPA